MIVLLPKNQENSLLQSSVVTNTAQLSSKLTDTCTGLIPVPGHELPTSEVQPQKAPEPSSPLLSTEADSDENEHAFAHRATSPDTELNYMLSPYGSDPLEGYLGPTVRLFNKSDAIIAVNNAQLCDPESATRISKVIKNLASHGEFRKLAQLSDDFHYGLRRLQEKYEQFREVIEYILSCAALAKHRGDGVLRMSPVLLIGDPGVGKTEFVVEFSELLDVGFKKIDLGASQSNAELAGSSAFWTNSAPSKIFLMASQGLYGECRGNPLFLLDEIDKPAESAGFTNGDPLGVLHTLLERHSSKTFVDLAIDIPIDVSNFTYFATCNDPDLIPRSLRTRFREFTISISERQMKKIACSIAEAMLKDLPQKRIAFDESTINALSQLDSPRLIRTYAQDALGRALVGGRDVIHPKDLRIEVRSKIKMGFL